MPPCRGGHRRRRDGGISGESEAEFEETRRPGADLPFTYLHVFTYSARRNAGGVHGETGPAREARNGAAFCGDLIAERS